MLLLHVDRCLLSAGCAPDGCWLQLGTLLPRVLSCRHWMRRRACCTCEWLFCGPCCQGLLLFEGMLACPALPSGPACLPACSRRLLGCRNAPLPCSHKRGIIHRDLKSPNLLIDSQWRCKVRFMALHSPCACSTAKLQTCACIIAMQGCRTHSSRIVGPCRWLTSTCPSWLRAPRAATPRRGRWRGPTPSGWCAF